MHPCHSFRLMIPTGSESCLNNVIFASHLDGANGSTTVINDGDPANSGTLIENAEIQTAEGMFGSQSAFIPKGNSPPSYLSINQFNYHSGNTNITFELFFKFTGSVLDTDAGGLLNIGGNQIQVFKSSDGQIRVNAGGSSVNIGAYPEGTWTHLALTVSDTQTKVYIDGILKFTKATAFVWSQLSARVGANSGTELQGYVDEVIVTDEVKYTGNFTPPDAPYITCITLATCVDGVLFHFDNDVVDSGPHNLTATIVETNPGTVTFDPGRFGSGIAIDDVSQIATTTAYVEVEASPFMAADDTEDFTLEFFAMVNHTPNNYPEFLYRCSNTHLRYEEDTRELIFTNTGAFSMGIAPLDTWFHVAIVREATIMKGYIDGIEQFSVAQGFPFADVAQITSFLHNQSLNGGWGGHCAMDEFSFVKGQARYTSNFTPPTQPLVVCP